MKTAFRVKAYKHPRLKYLVRGKEGGKWKRKFFETKRDAQTYAELKNIELQNQGEESISFPTELRVMAQKAHELLVPFGKTLLDAAQFYLPHLKAMRQLCTVRATFDELIASRRQDGASKRYLMDLNSRLGQFAQAFGGKCIAEITTTNVDGWLRGLPVSNLTRNNFRRVLIVAFNFAKTRGYCLTNPAKQADKAKEIEGEIEIFTVRELASLLENAGEQIVPFIAIGAFAGLRRAELERLDWSEVDFASGLITVTAAKAKSARRRFVTITPSLAAWLRPHAKLEGAVVPSNYREQLAAAREAAALKEWPQNGLRHSFASYHLAHFKNAAELALQLGHTNARLVFQHYRELVKPRQARQYWKITPKLVARLRQRRIAATVVQLARAA